VTLFAELRPRKTVSMAVQRAEHVTSTDDRSAATLLPK